MQGGALEKAHVGLLAECISDLLSHLREVFLLMALDLELKE